jgi:exodeoxyribonuclease VII small subunit
MENNFEQNLKLLENVVKQLENKEISLDLAVKLYKEGLELSKKCYDELKQNEEVIVKEMKNNKLEDYNR